MGRIIALMNIWMVPAFFVFVAGWLVGGGHLLRKSLHKRDPSRKPPKFGSCVLSVFLAGSAGGFVAVVIAYFFYVLAVFTELKYWLAVPGGVVALIAMVFVCFAVFWAKYEVTYLQAVKLGSPAIGSVLAVGLLLVLVVGVPSYLVSETTKSRNESKNNLLRIHNGILLYERALGRPPESIDELVEKNYLASREVKSPAFPDKKVGFFYKKISLLRKRDAAEQRKIVACDFGGGQIGSGRRVLMVNRDCDWYDENEFQELLAEEINAEFAAALRAAEGS